MGRTKPFQTYDQQLHRLQERGLYVDDREWALDWLARVNYYRLSGYWYPFRVVGDGRRLDEFRPGATFREVIDLYEFDERLRAAVLAAAAPIELSVRAFLGHGLGRLDVCAHLRPEVLGTLARTGDDYRTWRARFDREVASSREDFVMHHRITYDGVLPVWAAVEVLDWGSLVRLLMMSPSPVQSEVAARFRLRAPQLVSWLRALNIVRNACAHHGRLFNRVYSKRPKLPAPGLVPALDAIAPVTNRAFGQLSLLQYLRGALELGPDADLIRVLGSWPATGQVPLTVTGAPDDWRSSPLWH
ncbi:Abi family protein [Curtobacterium sp. VKM Ac-2922]|uniref:Abi family protein n=1 Tax=Curtobacterium sp. VKM Ac-2922 TaxID=2929475 RepID=UPI001FB21FFD|nr:Abi family protein [Curtobacterium sp. VKM Ac-2922]MCJ1713856.1 Abi family protein [Curtobacterium sp. VKM Ac-2922]